MCLFIFISNDEAGRQTAHSLTRLLCVCVCVCVQLKQSQEFVAVCSNEVHGLEAQLKAAQRSVTEHQTHHHQLLQALHTHLTAVKQGLLAWYSCTTTHPSPFPFSLSYKCCGVVWCGALCG
jgi:hypothetical protein